MDRYNKRSDRGAGLERWISIVKIGYQDRSLYIIKSRIETIQIIGRGRSALQAESQGFALRH